MARELASILTSHRKRKGLSVQTLAVRSGLSETDIERFEEGTHAPDIDQLFKLAAVFGVEAYGIARRIDAFSVKLAESESAVSEGAAS